MDPNNPAVKLCMEGMQAEAEGKNGAALRLFTQAWEASRDDFEACVAAHYLARQQTTPQDVLRWNQEALNGAYGMAALLDDNNNLYVTDWSPFEEPHYRARFYLDPNSIPMTSGNAHYLFYALDRDSHPLLRVELRYSAPDYQVRADAVIDNWSWSQTAWVTIGDAPHLLELDWQAATAAGANDGVLTFWVDGVQQASITNLDNDTRRIDYVQWGIVGGVDNGSRGTLYFDAFESRRESYIGPLAELLRFEVALGEVQAHAIRWLGSAWDSIQAEVAAAQVATHKLAASLVWHFRPAVRAFFAQRVFYTRMEPPAVEQSVAGITSTAEGPLPVLDTTAIRFTPVLAPLTLTARSAPIKVLAAPPPAEPARPQPSPLLASGYTTTRTITYTYNPLYRLTRADYSDGTYFRYTYDAVGNRLSEETTGGTVNSYTFDAANRLTSVDGVPYTWDNNGNLLSDGVYTYTFNHANRLVGVSGVGKTVSYTYSGLGDRLSQTAGITTTNYTLDLAANLTQVLSDGTDTYLYGNGRIAQYDASGTQHFQGNIFRLNGDHDGRVCERLP
jgi:YD repeat-containing protein